MIRNYERGLLSNTLNAWKLAEAGDLLGAAALAGVESGIWHVYGYLAEDDPAFCEPLLDVCRALELLVIEDAPDAQYTNQYLLKQAARAYARAETLALNGGLDNAETQG